MQLNEPVSAEIESLSHDGRGIARINGKTTFIYGALPGEQVKFKYRKRKSDFDEGEVIAIENASSMRVGPKCPFFGTCGGCSLQHIQPEEQIHQKQALFLNMLERIGHCVPEEVLPPLTDESWHYRNKARLSVRYVEKQGAVLVGFRERNNPRYITKMDQCLILNPKVSDQLNPIKELIASLDAAKDIAQVEVAASDDAVALIFRNLVPLNPVDTEKLKYFAEKTNFRIYLQPKGEDSVYLLYPEGDDYLEYTLPSEQVRFRFFPTDFTQVNSGLNRKMVSLALGLLELNNHDMVIDLFCGLGNFSLPIAKQANHVVGIEGSSRMVLRAQMNAVLNGIQNATFMCANLEDAAFYAQIKPYRFTKMLLDPPRTGAFEIVKNIENINPLRIVYVSCNPATLARDADILVNQKGYFMRKVGVMDMFPQSTHVESIALFERR